MCACDYAFLPLGRQKSLVIVNDETRAHRRTVECTLTGMYPPPRRRTRNSPCGTNLLSPLSLSLMRYILLACNSVRLACLRDRPPLSVLPFLSFFSLCILYLAPFNDRPRACVCASMDASPLLTAVTVEEVCTETIRFISLVVDRGENTTRCPFIIVHSPLPMYKCF